MKKIDTIVKATHFFTMDDDGVGYKTGMSMLVDGGKILDFIDNNLLDKEYKADEIIELNHHAVFPGLIDCHMHTSYNVMRGLAQDITNWMMYGIQPFDNILTQEDRDRGSEVAIIEAIKAGTTTLGDYETDMDNVCNFILKSGARGNIAQMIREAKRKVYNPGELYEFDSKQGEIELLRNIELFNKWNNRGNGRIKILYGPQGADFVSPEMLLKIKKVARDGKTKIHMHVQQGARETDQIMKRYGKRPTQFLEEIGYLDQDLIAVHLTDCNDEETRLIARSGATMIVNPASISIIDGIVCPSVAFQEAGGYVGLGSDQAPGNNCHNIIHEMKNVCLFNKIKYKNPEVMPAWKALRMATIEGAKAIGVDRFIGSLEPGKCADYIAIDLDKPSMLPVYLYPMRNIVPNFVYSARGNEVVLSVVNGEIIMKDGVLTKIDENKSIQKIKECPARIGEKAAEEFFRINGINADFMKEGKL